MKPEIAEEMFKKNPRGVLAWGPTNNAKAVAENGGYRVNGVWPFASGSKHATWLAAHCIVMRQDGKCAATPKASRCRRHLWCRANAPHGRTYGMSWGSRAPAATLNADRRVRPGGLRRRPSCARSRRAPRARAATTRSRSTSCSARAFRRLRSASRARCSTILHAGAGQNSAESKRGVPRECGDPVAGRCHAVELAAARSFFSRCVARTSGRRRRPVPSRSTSAFGCAWPRSMPRTARGRSSKPGLSGRRRYRDVRGQSV